MAGVAGVACVRVRARTPPAGRSGWGGGRPGGPWASTSGAAPGAVACLASPPTPLVEGGKGWTVVSLKAELKRLGLPQTGRKAELVARLLEAREGSPPPAAEGGPPAAGAAPKQRTLYVDWSSAEDAAASERYSVHFDALKGVVDSQFPGEYRVVPRGGQLERGSFELYLDDASVDEGEEPTLVYSTLCIGRLPDPHMDVLQNLMVFMARERKVLAGKRGESAGG